MFFITGRIRKIAENSGWVIGQNIYFMLIGVFVTAIVARYFGPALFGQFSYAIATVTLFTAFATLGLESLTVKALIDRQTDEGAILFTSLILRLAGGLVLTALSLFTIAILTQGDKVLLTIGFIYSLFLTLRALEVFEFWAQAKMALKMVALIKMATFTVTSALKLAIVFWEGSLIGYASIFLIDALLTGFAVAIAYYLVREDKTKWRFSLVYAREILSKCWPVAISGLMVTVYMRIDQVMLGTMLTDKSEVGIYAVAVRLAEMWYFVPMALIASFRPIIMQYKADQNKVQYMAAMRAMYSVTFWLGVVFGLVIASTSGVIVNVVYGQEFSRAAPVLAVSVWAGTIGLLGVARSVWLVSENLQRYTIVYALSGAVINVVLNFILIPAYGAIGAAYASLCAQATNILVLVMFKDTRQHTFLLLRSLSPVYMIEVIKNRIVRTKKEQ